MLGEELVSHEWWALQSHGEQSRLMGVIVHFFIGLSTGMMMTPFWWFLNSFFPQLVVALIGLGLLLVTTEQ